MANSNEYNLRSKGGLGAKTEETRNAQELIDDHLKEPSIDSGSDLEDYTVDYTRINNLKSSLSKLGVKHLDLANDNKDGKNGENIAKIENAIDRRQAELEELLKDAQEVNAARMKREFEHAARIIAKEETIPPVRDHELFGHPTETESPEERRIRENDGLNSDHRVKPNNGDS